MTRFAHFRPTAVLLAVMGCAGSPEPQSAALPGTPGGSPTAPLPDLGAVALVFENDFFAGEDDNYTNGVTSSYVTPPLGKLAEKNTLRQYASLFQWLPEFGEDDRDERISFSIVHSMFTPEDISVPDPPLDDQPYAGIAAFDQAFTSREARVQHTYLLRLGWVGPRTRAEEIQKEVHEITGSSEPLGWATQLPDEGIVNLGYEYRREVGHSPIGSGCAADLTVDVGCHLGNYFTGGIAGVTGRVGWNLPDAVGTAAPRSGLQSDAVRGTESASGWRIGLTAGVEGFAIARYMPLDGTLFRDSRSVDDRAPFVGSLTLGLDCGYGPFGISLSFSKLTETFRGERSDNEFGTVVIGWSF